MRYIAYLLIFSTICCMSCKKNKSENTQELLSMNHLKIEKNQFGTIGEQIVDQYTLSNGNISVDIITYGGIVRRLMVPDEAGEMRDVVLGFNSIEEYLSDHPFFGAIIGRYGNRIANGKFSIDGTQYTLAQNNGVNALHGGIKGFDKVIWAAEPIESDSKVGVKLVRTSPDGEEGYPGNLAVTVTYELDQDNQITINYAATTDQTTTVNLTNHSYFNLNGEGRGDILDHILMIDAQAITPVDEGLIPTGALMPVAGTPFDFATAQSIGDRIDDTSDLQISYGGGYDHNYVLNGADGSLKRIATAYASDSGIEMTVSSTEPGVQFYTGNFLDGTLIGKSGVSYQKRSGFCLETQHYPDSPNQPNFPSTLLKPGQEYKSTTIYQFGIRE